MTNRKQALIELRDKLKAGEVTSHAVDLHLARSAVGDEWYSAALAYNGSLDAAKALHEAVLPKLFWNMGHLDEPSLGYVATVADGHFADSPSWRGYAMTPARAWLLAILEALIAQEDAV
jgi:hypothetical protein